MTMTFYLWAVLIAASLYAFIITTQPGQRFTETYPWLAFALGEMIIVAAVAMMGTVNATDLFLLNAAGALPMVMRWAYLGLAADNRRTLRTLYGTTQGLDGRERTDTD